MRDTEEALRRSEEWNWKLLIFFGLVFGALILWAPWILIPITLGIGITLVVSSFAAGGWGKMIESIERATGIDLPHPTVMWNNWKARDPRWKHRTIFEKVAGMLLLPLFWGAIWSLVLVAFVADNWGAWWFWLKRPHELPLVIGLIILAAWCDRNLPNDHGDYDYPYNL